MRLRWPPAGLGLDAPYLCGLFGGQRKPGFLFVVMEAAIVGAAIAVVMLAIDRFFFAGVSLGRIGRMGLLPIEYRVLIILYSSFTEELIYRFFLMTLVAWLAARLFRMAPTAAVWLGILVSALLFGLAHIANVPEAEAPVLRAVAINGVAGIWLGLLYWRRGIESAWLAHLSAAAFIYLGVASTLASAA